MSGVSHTGVEAADAMAKVARGTAPGTAAGEIAVDTAALAVSVAVGGIRSDKLHREEVREHDNKCDSSKTGYRIGT